MEEERGGVGGRVTEPVLHHALLRILPAQLSYEAFVCLGDNDDNAEKVSTGQLEPLLPHMPRLGDLLSTGCDANFKLQLSGQPSDAPWFTKSTFNRFLLLVGSPEFFNTTKAIEAEMLQLEQARNFHASLYSQSQGNAALEDSSNSRSELLQAMDLRLTALRIDLNAALEKAVGSSREVIDLANFCDHFGARELKNTLCAFVNRSQELDAIIVQKNHSDSERRMLKAGFNRYKAETAEKKGPAYTIAHVKYGASPALAAQVERWSSTDDEKCSCSSGEDETPLESLERGRASSVSAPARRSASPMRKIQIARSKSRRTPALTIKSLNYHPGRGRSSFSRDGAATDGKEEGSEVLTGEKVASKMRMMTVQDAISIFENKQRDQNKEGEKNNSLPTVSVCAVKPVLRRWSGVAESSTPFLVDPTLSDTDMQYYNVPSPCSDTENEALAEKLPDEQYFDQSGPICQSFTKGSDAEVEGCGENAESPADAQIGCDISGEHKSKERLVDSSDWIKQKEVEFSEMVKMMESQDQKSRRLVTRNQISSLTQKVRQNDRYKKKNDGKLQRKHILERGENQTPHVTMKQRLPARKVGPSFLNAKGIVGIGTVSKKCPELLENSSDSANLRSGTRKTSIIKKSPSKPAASTASRKSQPSVSSSKPAGLAPSRISSTRVEPDTKSTRRKTSAVSTSPQSSGRVGGHRPNQSNVKESHSFGKTTKDLQKTLKRSEKEQKEKVPAVREVSSDMVPLKSSVPGKTNKKSSVVPIDSRVFNQKRLGASHGVGLDIKKKQLPHKSKKNVPKQDSTMHTSRDAAHVDASVLESANDQHNIVPESGICLSTEGLEDVGQIRDKKDNLNELATGIFDANKEEPFPAEVPFNNESGISPAAWVEHVADGQQNLHHPNNCAADQKSSLVHVATIGSSTSRVRHSLSEMLQEDASEPDTPDWGNAENPLSLFYQKDASKGLKRLLKLSRKIKGDVNISEWSTTPAFRKGGEAAEIEAVGNKNTYSLHIKEANHSGDVQERARNPTTSSERTNLGSFRVHHSSYKLHKDHVSTAVPKTKGQSCSNFDFLDWFSDSFAFLVFSMEHGWIKEKVAFPDTRVTFC